MRLLTVTTDYFEPGKQFQQLRTDVEGLHPLQTAAACPSSSSCCQGVREPVQLGFDDGAQVLVFPHDRYFLSIDDQREKDLS